MKRAKYNLNKKKHESSLFDLKQCLKIDSTNSECNYLAALCYFEISKYDKSKSEYGKLALRTIKNALSSDQNNFLALALYVVPGTKLFLFLVNVPYVTPVPPTLNHVELLVSTLALIRTKLNEPLLSSHVKVA